MRRDRPGARPVRGCGAGGTLACPVHERIELLLELGGASRLVAADLDGDGRPRSRRHRRRTSGGLAQRRERPLRASLDAGRGRRPFTLGDFDGDGHVDLAFANRSAQVVQVFSGNGDGTFRSPRMLAARSTLLDVAAGDFDGDGATDLAILVNGFSLETHLQRHGTLAESPVTSFANGYTTLSRRSISTATGAPTSSCPTLNSAAPRLCSFLLRGDGTFSSSTRESTAAAITSDTARRGRRRRDGHPDVVVVNPATETRRRSTSFTTTDTFDGCPALTLERLYSRSVTVADFDGDGRLEIGVG